MNKKSYFVIKTFIVLSVILVIEIFYLYNKESLSEKALKTKKEFVAQVGLSDLAISTEASYIRHRSLSDFFSPYRDDGALRDYFASSFVYREGVSEKQWSNNEK